MTTKRRLSILVSGGLLCGAWPLASGATLDEATARTAITQSSDNVLAALVQVETRCHREDPVCLDGVRVVQVLLEHSDLGRRIAAGDRIALQVDAGAGEVSPAIGDQILFVGVPLDPKDTRSDYTAKVMTLAPSRKDVDELRWVISSTQHPETSSAP